MSLSQYPSSQQTESVSALVIATLEHRQDITVSVSATDTEEQIRERMKKRAEQMITNYTCLFDDVSPDIVDTVIILHDSEKEFLISEEFLSLLPIIHRCWEWCLHPLDHPADRIPYLRRVTDALASHLSEVERQLLFKILYGVFGIDPE